MRESKYKGRKKITITDVKEAITYIAKNNQSQDKKLITVREVQTYLQIEKGIHVNDKTIRNNGLRHQGYFEKKYPKACSYNHKGDMKYRGLIIKPEQFLEQIKQ